MRYSFRHSMTILMIFTLLFAVACSSQSSSGTNSSAKPSAAAATPGATTAAPQDSAKPGEKVELRWFMWTGSQEEKALWEDLAKKVTEKYPNITVKFETDTFPGYWDKLQAQIASGSVPDIISLQALRTATFAQFNAFEPLGPYIQKTPDFDIGDFEKAILNALGYKGNQLAIPYDFGAYVLYYNKDMFDKYGVKYPEEGMTWDQFLEKAKALTKDGNYGFTFRNVIDQVAPWIWSNGGDIYTQDETKSTITDPKAVEAMQFLGDLMNKHKVAAPITDPGNDNFYREQFYAGKAAMYLDGPWNLGNVRSKAKFNWDISTMPAGKAGSVVFSNGSGFGIYTKSKHKEEAWQAITQIVGKDGINLLAKSGRAYPARRSAVETFIKADPRPARMDIISKAGTNVKVFGGLTNWQETQLMMNKEMDKIWFNNTPAADVAKSIDPQLNKALETHLKNIKK